MSLIFLKLGGSLITDKTHPYSVRPDKLDALASEIASVLTDYTELQLLLGHGSGSFGHEAASHYDTRRGVSGPQAWRGFAEVWYQASGLDHLVVEALHQANLPVVAFSPVASVIAQEGKALLWDSHPIQVALSHGLLPVIYGDVAFDEIWGGTILSTEDLFYRLACDLHPERILLAGLEEGVWADFPARKHLLKEITPDTYTQQAPGLGVTYGADVTGGMNSKVTGMLALLEEMPKLEILIFSGEQPKNIRLALNGENPGTCLHR
ncbi:MAG: isopentenyl phosphate kinase [Anaerolineales bacterium]|jgi:isopentenyl phosphate kinase